jgi:hypothetical protein
MLFRGEQTVLMKVNYSNACAPRFRSAAQWSCARVFGADSEPFALEAKTFVTETGSLTREYVAANEAELSGLMCAGLSFFATLVSAPLEQLLERRWEG